MDSKYEDFRRNAQVCIHMSGTTGNTDMKASWLQLAEAWLRMIPVEPVEPHASARDRFEKAAMTNGTRQRHSLSSH